MTFHTTPQPPHDPRTVEILAGVRRAFAQKGFDGASMQDLARACGMSVGNFYRYFPSKAAIVAAMILRDQAELETSFRDIIGSPDPLSALRAGLRQRIGQGSCDGEAQLWAEMTAASLRKADISAVTTQMEHAVVSYLTAVFARVKGIAPETARQRYYPQAMLIIMMVKGSAMHPAENSAQQEGLTDLVLRTIDRIIDDVASDDPKG